MKPRLAQFFNAGALVLDTQCKSTKHIIQLPRDFRLPFVPPGTFCEWPGLIPSIHLGGIKDHGDRVTTLVSRFFCSEFLKHLRKKLFLEIVGIKHDSAQYVLVRY